VTDDLRPSCLAVGQLGSRSRRSEAGLQAAAPFTTAAKGSASVTKPTLKKRSLPRQRRTRRASGGPASSRPFGRKSGPDGEVRGGPDGEVRAWDELRAGRQMAAARSLSLPIAEASVPPSLATGAVHRRSSDRRRECCCSSWNGEPVRLAAPRCQRSLALEVPVGANRA
jgi:hypothetical protein